MSCSRRTSLPDVAGIGRGTVRETTGTMFRLLLIVAVLASTASADVSTMVGVGVSRIDDANNDTPLMPALDVFVGARLDAHWSVGGRLQTSWPLHSSELLNIGGGGDFEQADYTYQALDLGLSARYENSGWWIAPWIGEHVTSVTDHDFGQSIGASFDDTSSDNVYAFELGLTAGIDVYASGSDRLSIYADYHHAVGHVSWLPPDSERTP